MISLDNEKDLFIKEKFRKDELISKKADDVFNNFLEGKTKMEEEKETIVNKTKDKIIYFKRILSVAAMFVVIFLGANVYAVTQGYDNIFFMIKNMSTSGTVTGKKDILKDQDITISYKTIEIAEGVSVQFNRFTVKDNKATLFMGIDQVYGAAEDKKISLIEIENEDDNSQLATKTLKNNNNLGEEEIDIGFFKDDIKNLKVTIYSSTEKLAVMRIDLTNREIVILSNSYNELEKISEIELKEVLSKYAILNSYEDFDIANTDNEELNFIVNGKPTKGQFINNNLVQCAIECTKNEDFYDAEYGVGPEKMNKAIKEMTGLEVKDRLDVASTFYEYNKDADAYWHANGDGSIAARCLNITDISYEDGIYTVDYQYFYTGDDAITRIKNTDAYESTIQFKINEDYEYIKYKIVSDVYNLKSKKIVDDTKEDDKNVVVDEKKSDYISIEQAALEYRIAEKITNYKDFNYDLDGDGKLDKITIRKDKTDEYGINYFFELDGQVFAEEQSLPEIYIVDVDKNDNRLEVIIFDNGPSDDPEYNIYVKNGNKMELAETISGIDMVLNGIGNLKAKSTLAYFIEPDAYGKIYSLDNNMLSYKKEEPSQEEYTLKGICYITESLENLDKYYSGDYEIDGIDDEHPRGNLEKLNIYELKVNEPFKIKSFLNDTEALIEYNGKEYYLLSDQGHFCD